MKWECLQAIALEEVRTTLADLPEPLREKAQAVPVTCHSCPSALQLEDGIEPDTLGLFVGPSYADQEITSFPVPPQIILFLKNLWDFAEGDEEIYREEVHTTYLHELGHYLGLDEDGLVERGLE